MMKSIKVESFIRTSWRKWWQVIYHQKAWTMYLKSVIKYLISFLDFSVFWWNKNYPGNIVYPSPTIIPKTAHTPPIKQSPRTSPKKNGFACRNCFKPPYLSNVDLTNHPTKIENHRLFNGHSPGEETNPIGCNGHQIKLLRIQYRPVIIIAPTPIKPRFTQLVSVGNWNCVSNHRNGVCGAVTKVQCCMFNAPVR